MLKKIQQIIQILRERGWTNSGRYKEPDGSICLIPAIALVDGHTLDNSCELKHREMENCIDATHNHSELYMWILHKTHGVVSFNDDQDSLESLERDLWELTLNS